MCCWCEIRWLEFVDVVRSNSIAGTSVGFWLVCVFLRARMCFLGRND